MSYFLFYILHPIINTNFNVLVKGRKRFALTLITDLTSNMEGGGGYPYTFTTYSPGLA